MFGGVGRTTPPEEGDEGGGVEPPEVCLSVLIQVPPEPICLIPEYSLKSSLSSPQRFREIGSC